MVSGLVEVLFQIGMWKVILTALGWVSGIGSFTMYIITGFAWGDDRRDWVNFSRLGVSIFLTLLCIACITVYVSPAMKEEMVLARQVAPMIDDYAERNPESIYNSDVLLTAGSNAVLGIVGTASELPGYLKKFAEGGVRAIIPSKSLSDMTSDEIRRLSNDEYNRLKNQ